MQEGQREGEQRSKKGGRVKMREFYRQGNSPGEKAHPPLARRTKSQQLARHTRGVELFATVTSVGARALVECLCVHNKRGAKPSAWVQGPMTECLCVTRKGRNLPSLLK